MGWGGVSQVLSRISPKIAKPAVFFFLREAFAPSIGQIMVRRRRSRPALLASGQPLLDALRSGRRLIAAAGPDCAVCVCVWQFYWYTSAPGGPQFKADFLVSDDPLIAAATSYPSATQSARTVANPGLACLPVVCVSVLGGAGEPVVPGLGVHDLRHRAIQQGTDHPHPAHQVVSDRQQGS